MSRSQDQCAWKEEMKFDSNVKLRAITQYHRPDIVSESIVWTLVMLNHCVGEGEICVKVDGKGEADQVGACIVSRVPDLKQVTRLAGSLEHDVTLHPAYFVLLLSSTDIQHSPAPFISCIYIPFQHTAQHDA
jgi:hypothetical protein